MYFYIIRKSKNKMEKEKNKKKKTYEMRYILSKPHE
jgi:hypothetical protein